jgi:uncharacterized protein YnzC (UPF0291/DUF896 family)
MDKEKITRISELTRLSRQRPLTDEEQGERAALRREYLDGFRANVEAMLQDVSICEADGSTRPLQKKPMPPEQ